MNEYGSLIPMRSQISLLSGKPNRVIQSFREIDFLGKQAST